MTDIGGAGAEEKRTDAAQIGTRRRRGEHHDGLASAPVDARGGHGGAGGDVADDRDDLRVLIQRLRHAHRDVGRAAVVQGAELETPTPYASPGVDLAHGQPRAPQL